MSHHSPKPTNLLHLLLGAALLAGLMFGLAPLRVAHAATFTVNTTADTTDANPGDGVCADSGGACSLRAAIREANSLTGADTITLPAGTYTLTRAGASENLNATGDLDIRSAITLNGAGASSTIIDANQLDRVFDIEASGATVVLDGITITNGKTPNADIAHCEGGGIYVKETTLTLRNSVVTGNTTGYHTGANWINMGCFGGGIYRGGSGTVTIENSTIRNNNAGTGHGGGGGGGGGVYNDSGNTIIRDSTLSSNASGDGVSSGDGDGGGIFLYGGSMTIQNSTLNGNTAVTGASGGNGGGIYASDSTVTIQNSTLSGNTAATDQGGGGLLVTSSATAYLIHSTVTGNAGGWGGGIDNQGTTTLKNSIIVGNDGNAATRDDCYIPSGTLTSQGYNLVGSGTGCPSDGTGDQSTTDARLGPLQDNGGPTQTHALLYNSPAVEVIPNGTNGCGTDYTTDQRGSVRPGGGLCDVGAYESPYIFWDGGGADNNTSTAANWSGDVTPAATDIPIFGSASSNNATINADLTVGGWLMEASYGGTISQGSYNLTVNGDWAQSGGTFTGGSGALDLGGAFNLSGGSFTAPSGLMTISGVFSHTGGSFAPSTGRVILGSTTNQTLATTFHDLVLNDGLLGYWKLDEGGGTTAYDASGYGYDGVLNNSPAWYTNVPTTMDFYDPYSLGFDRTSSPGYVAMSDTLKINAAQKLTLSTWVRLAAMPTGSGYTYMRFITLVGEKAVLRYYDYNGTDKLQFYMKIGGSIRSVLVNQTWATNTWYHVAGTYDGSVMRLYLDGVEKGTYTFAGTVDAGNGVRLSHSTNEEALDGRLDDVRIYDRALSAAEIGDLAAGKHPRSSVATTTLGAALDVNGDLTLNSGTLDVSASNYAINVAGDFTRNGGVFTAHSGAVTFDGSGAQALDTDAIAFYNLTVNSGSTLVDLADFTVDGTLTSNGALQQRQFVQDGATTQFLRIKNAAGDVTKYYGLDIIIPLADPDGSLDWTTVTIKDNQDCTTTAGETVRRCFDIAPTRTTKPADLLFYFADSQLSGNDCNALNAYHKTGGAWQQLTLDASWGGDGRVCESEPYSVKAKNVTSFSPFALKSGSPLAVRLATFTAAPGGGGVRLMWETVSELDNLGFHLYRAAEGEDVWLRLDAALIPSQAPGAAGGYVYTWLDRGVQRGTTYRYRLEAVELSGHAQRLDETTVGFGAALWLPTVVR